MVADIAHGFILACDWLWSLENPLSSFVFLCGVLYLLQAGLDCLRPRRKVVEAEEARLRLTAERVDDSPVVELNTLTNKMKQKSRKIVMDAERGEARTAIQKCKNFLSAVQSSNFACKIFINSWEVSSVLFYPAVFSVYVCCFDIRILTALRTLTELSPTLESS